MLGKRPGWGSCLIRGQVGGQTVQQQNPGEGTSSNGALGTRMPPLLMYYSDVEDYLALGKAVRGEVLILHAEAGPDVIGILVLPSAALLVCSLLGFMGSHLCGVCCFPLAPPRLPACPRLRLLPPPCTSAVHKRCTHHLLPLQHAADDCPAAEQGESQPPCRHFSGLLLPLHCDALQAKQCCQGALTVRISMQQPPLPLSGLPQSHLFTAATIRMSQFRWLQLPGVMRQSTSPIPKEASANIGGPTSVAPHAFMLFLDNQQLIFQARGIKNGTS